MWLGRILMMLRRKFTVHLRGPPQDIRRHTWPIRSTAQKPERYFSGFVSAPIPGLSTSPRDNEFTTIQRNKHKLKKHHNT